MPTAVSTCQTCTVSEVLLLLQIEELRAEFQHENEEMLEAIRQLSWEVSRQTLIINSYVPREYQVRSEMTSTLLC